MHRGRHPHRPSFRQTRSLSQSSSQIQIKEKAMPITPTYPGIYIEELPSSAHTITAAPTSIAVFVGYTHPFKTRSFGQAVRLFSFTDYEREFGGFFSNS